MQRARYSQHPSRAQQQQATPCTCGRCALYVVELLSNLRSVTHHVYLLELCSSYMLHVFARTWFRKVPARRCWSSDSTTTAVWVEIVQIMFLTIAIVRFSQAAKRRQQYVRISHLPVIHLMHHAHCCLRCWATVNTLLLYVWYQKEAGGIFLCLNIKRDGYDT